MEINVLKKWSVLSKVGISFLPVLYVCASPMFVLALIPRHILLNISKCSNLYLTNLNSNVF